MEEANLHCSSAAQHSPDHGLGAAADAPTSLNSHHHCCGILPSTQTVSDCWHLREALIKTKT